MNPTRTEAIGRFLRAKTHLDLANMYSKSMEVQVNVAREGGERVESNYEGRQWLAWTDGIQVWKSFRIPRNAKTEPIYEESPQNFDFEKYVEGIGMTGWDWENKMSRWVAFDFDAITGHSQKHAKKLTDADLENVKNVLTDIPWVTIRHSTSGKGLHVYVFLDPVPASNHIEHAAVARAVLHYMAGITGFDLQAKVDICGGNMWVWHRKMKGTNGLEIIKQGTTMLSAPKNWRDHLVVTRGTATKNRPSFLNQLDLTEDVFQQLCGQRNRVTLDEEHRNLIKHLESNGAFFWFDNDHHMLVCHTTDLQTAHAKLNMRGDFQTISEGRMQGSDHNCWCHPMTGGGWVVRRYGPGTAEAPTWTIDDRGYTLCYLNRELDFETLCRVNNGVEHPKGGFVFDESGSAELVLRKMGAMFQLPEATNKRNCRLLLHKEPGKIIIDMVSEKSDSNKDFVLWVRIKDGWQRVVKTKVNNDPGDVVTNCDNLVRHLVNIDGENQDWIVNVEGSWNEEPLPHVRTALKSLDYKPGEIDQIIGINVMQPWKIVNKPFEMEYPGNREWNRRSAQLKFVPNPNKEGVSYPTWQKILDHVGKNLTEAILDSEWCQENGIKTGAEYLKIWIASLFKEPTEPLPYLFLYSKEQNTGKSTLHEALSRLMTSGYVRADSALVNQAGFNGELRGALLCAIEETDVARQKGVYNRIKDWVTGRTISIHQKGETPFLAVNTTHWIQTSNDRWACPIDFGDTRITMIRVDSLAPTELIPKTELEKLLDKEAPDFLADILGVEIPDSNDRLNVPVINTQEKQQAMQLKVSALTRFLEEKCVKIPGHYVLVSDFMAAFITHLDTDEVNDWTKRKVFQEMPSEILYGRLTQGEDNSKMAFGNISLALQPIPNHYVYWLDQKYLKRKITTQ